jgi:hypothetical protein
MSDEQKSQIYETTLLRSEAKRLNAENKELRRYSRFFEINKKFHLALMCNDFVAYCRKDTKFLSKKVEKTS